MSLQHLTQRVTSMNGIDIPDSENLRVPAGEIRAAIAEAAAMRRARADLAAKYDELLVALHGIGRALGIEEADRSPYSITCGVLDMANRLAEIEAQEPVAHYRASDAEWLAAGRCATMYKDPAEDWTVPLYTHPVPAAAPDRAADLDADIIEAQRAVVRQLASRPACEWPGNCKHQRPSPAAAPELAEPADPRTPPPGCRLLGDYEPAQAGDMAYIGAIGGRWRKVRPRMGIIGATMDELSDGARVLALARPCRCGPDSRSDSTSCPRGVMTISVYYFCAEYRDDQLTHSMSGTIQSDMPPFHEDFHARLTERIAANMKPPRPADLVSVRSLSLLATRKVEHGDVWARQSGRDDGGHAEHDGADADAERAYCEAVTLCAAAIGRRMREGGR